MRTHRPAGVLSTLLVVLATTVPAVASAQSTAAPPRSIIQLRGNLHAFEVSGRASLFLVTRDGIIVLDPLGTPTARWLRNELAGRFPGRPVKYVVQTAPRYERAAGTSIFTDTAEIIAHEDFVDERRRAAEALPPELSSLDRNADNLLERSETIGLPPEDVAVKDANRNNEITAAEAWADVSQPDSTFGQRRTIELGGERVELIHPGRGFGRGATLVYFPTQQLVFVVGVPATGVPAVLPASAPEFIRSLRQLESMPFDLVLTDRGLTARHDHIAQLREYVEVLLAAARDGVRGGRGVDAVQATLEPTIVARFTGLDDVDGRWRGNLAQVYRTISLGTLNLNGALALVQMQRGRMHCDDDPTPTIATDCNGTGGRGFAGGGGVSAMFGQMGAALEMTAGTTMTGVDHRFRGPRTDFEHQETLMAFLARVSPNRDSRLVITGGMVRVSVRQTCSTENGAINCAYPRSMSVFTPIVGADLQLTTGPIRLVAPIRSFYAPGRLYGHAGGGGNGKWNLHAGLGASIPLARGVF